MKIAIVILHFGQKDATQACIKSLYEKETYPFSLILVNNTPCQLTKKDFLHHEMTILNNEANLGFAGGVNVGIGEALSHSCDAILLLNNDTEITEPILSTLVGSLESNRTLGIAAPVISFKKHKQTLYDLGGHIVMPFGRTFHTEVSSVSKIAAQKVDYVSGCCMLVKKEIFGKVGFFDERFFLYYEDVDFCLRTKAAGFDIKICPEVMVYHQLSKSAGKLSSFAIYHQLRSALLFGRKYSRSTGDRILNICFVVLQTVLFLKSSFSHTVQAMNAWKAAW